MPQLDEAIETQLFITQYSPVAVRSLSAKNNDLIDAIASGVSAAIVASLLRESYELFIQSLAKDADFLANYAYRRAYESNNLLIPGDKIKPNGLNHEIVLTDSKGKLQRITPLSHIKARYNEMKNTVWTAIFRDPANAAITSAVVLNRVFLQLKTITATYLYEQARLAREEVFTQTNMSSKYWMYLAILDSRTSMYCASQAYSVSNSPVGWPILPPAHWYCRSVIIPIDKPEDAEGIAKRAVMDNWLALKPESFQKEYLGASNFSKYKSGQLSGLDLVKALVRNTR